MTTFKTGSRPGPAMIGRMIRPGMTPGGFSHNVPMAPTEQKRRKRRGCMMVRDAAVAFLENRVVRNQPA